MKKIFRGILVNAFCFWIISFLAPGAINYSQNPIILFLASLTLTLLNLLIKPVVNLFFFPINLITLGTFKWFANILVLYLVTIIAPEFLIESFFFSGLTFNGFIVPAFNISLLGSYVLVAFLLELISGIIYSVFK